MTARISVELLREHLYERNEDWDAILVSATCSCGKLLNVPYFDQWLAHLESLQAERDAAAPQTSEVKVSEPNTFHGFAAMNRERCESEKGFNHPLESWTMSDWFTATLGELGEAANIAKKLNRVRDGIRGNTEETAALTVKLRQELGDAFVYLDLLAQSLGFNIGDAAFEVFDAKSKQLGYAAQPIAPDPSAAPPIHECVHCGCDTYNASMVCDSCTTHVISAPASTSEKEQHLSVDHGKTCKCGWQHPPSSSRPPTTEHQSHLLGVIAALEVSRDQLRAELLEAVESLRSAFSIAEREGMQTNWDTFRKSLHKTIERCVAALADPRSGENT